MKRTIACLFLAITLASAETLTLTSAVPLMTARITPLSTADGRRSAHPANSHPWPMPQRSGRG